MTPARLSAVDSGTHTVAWRCGWLAAALLLTCGPALAEPSLESYPAKGHPLDDYQQAGELFAKGDRETATCLFYRGQYRFRVRLTAHPDLDPSGEPALFGAFSETLGRPINEWAGGDPVTWAQAIGCALNWVQNHDDPFTPKAQNAEAHRQVEKGMRKLLDYVRGSAAEIRAERAARGLPNR